MKIKVADFGEFPWPEKLTYREMNLVKKVTQLRAGELQSALAAGDTDVLFAFALIAVKRSDKGAQIAEDSLLDLEIDQIDVIEEEADKKAAADGPPSVGGEASSESSETPPPSPPATTELHAITG